MSLPHSPLQSSRFANMWPEGGRSEGCPIDCDDKWQCRSGCADPNLKCSYCKIADGWWATRSLPRWCSRATATRRKRCCMVSIHPDPLADAHHFHPHLGEQILPLWRTGCWWFWTRCHCSHSHAPDRSARCLAAYWSRNLVLSPAHPLSASAPLTAGGVQRSANPSHCHRSG